MPIRLLTLWESGLSVPNCCANKWRRTAKRYFLQGYDKEGNPTSDKRRIVTTKFPPEYAHIIGVPFKLFKGGSIDPVDSPSYTRVFALHNRESLEITFPAVGGYRLDYHEGPIKVDFSRIDDY